MSSNKEVIWHGKLKLVLLPVCAFALQLFADTTPSATDKVRKTLLEMENGERATVISKDESGKESVTNIQTFRHIADLLSAPIGSKYVPMSDADYEGMKKSTAKEILVKIPEWQSMTAPKYWQKPRAVLLKSGSLECVGFFSASKFFETRQEAMNYFSDTIGAELKEWCGKDPMVNVVGKAEFSFAYEKDGVKRELRFKPFSVDGGQRSVILCYHGSPRNDGKTMENEFVGFWKYVTE